ncbi:MAG: protoporphyrinogen oxidase [Phycisphaerales bacterium]|nr:protoporphyrinogen oxidase [Phycisphaerales bacterium]
MADSLNQCKRILIIGGGVAGLAAAHRLTELAAAAARPLDLKLIEGLDRLGGSIVTRRKDGLLIEGGPDSFITAKPWGLALSRRLGIEQQLIPTNPACRRTFVVRRGRMYPIPEGFLLLAPTRIMPFVTSRLFSWPGKFRMGMDLLLPAKPLGPDDDESLGSFVRRRFGREALERVAQPLVGGIYTADPDKLSLRTTMPRFLEMEAQYGSLIRAMRKQMPAARAAQANVDSGARYSMFVAFRDGMDTLVNALADRLPTDAVQLGRSAETIDYVDTTWRVRFRDGRHESADGLIVATPAHVTGGLVRDLDATLADDLAAIPYASSATLSLAVRRAQLGRLPDGFGFVVPFSERRTIIAVTFSSIKFEDRAPADRILMRAFLGGALQPDVYALDDDSLYRAVMTDLRELIGLQGEPEFTDLYRWPLSMPQYPVGHLLNVRRIEQRLAARRTIAFAGNGFSGVGIPDCVHSGEQAAEKLFAALHE